MAASQRCPRCRERLLQKAADGAVKLRTTLVLFQQDGTALVKCRKCKHEVLIPAALGDELVKAVLGPGPRLVVTKGLRGKSLDPPDSAQ